MKYITDDGVEFFVVPDNARCKLKGVHPDYLYECPDISDTGYGGFKTTCTPYTCMYYDEE